MLIERKTCFECANGTINGAERDAGIPSDWVECNGEDVDEAILDAYTEDELPAHCGHFMWRDTQCSRCKAPLAKPQFYPGAWGLVAVCGEACAQALAEKERARFPEMFGEVASL